MIDAYIGFCLRGWNWHYNRNGDTWRFNANHVRNTTYRVGLVTHHSKWTMARRAVQQVRILNREIYLAEKTVL